MSTGDPSTWANQFLETACLRYAGPTSPALRRQARKLLDAHPEIVTGNLFVAATTGHLAEVRRILSADPGAAARPGGPRG